MTTRTQTRRRVFISDTFSLYMLNLDEKIIPVYLKKRTIEEVRQLLKSADEVVSAVGHAATAELFSRLLGVPISANRVEVKLEEGDILVWGIIDGAGEFAPRCVRWVTIKQTWEWEEI